MQAFIIGEKFIEDVSACLVLGDNSFYDSGFTSLLSKTMKDAEVIGKLLSLVTGYQIRNAMEWQSLIRAATVNNSHNLFGNDIDVTDSTWRANVYGDGAHMENQTAKPLSIVLQIEFDISNDYFLPVN